ncbi:hypothetical protein BDN70DRAFT_108963 [Pholiota conissans]|uniref:Uncharacterized protein n=1 Tax=Pholiota conissans TaxID=109636 RepID=A0A9P5YZM8_9AGAR|nr:hypothetical protein BDN70DRAFT_108963 [Pholiota conissans]
MHIRRPPPSNAIRLVSSVNDPPSLLYISLRQQIQPRTYCSFLQKQISCPPPPPLPPPPPPIHPTTQQPRKVRNVLAIVHAAAPQAIY